VRLLMAVWSHVIKLGSFVHIPARLGSPARLLSGFETDQGLAENIEGNAPSDVL